MKSLSDFTGKKLIVKQPSILKNYFEIFLEDEVVGSVEFKNKFSSKAYVKFFDAQWEIKKESFWRNQTGVYKIGYELPMASYIQKFGKGTLRLDKGRILYFRFNLWKGLSEIKTETGKVLVSGKNKVRFKAEMEIEIIQKNEFIDNYPWLILLLLYLKLARRQY